MPKSLRFDLGEEEAARLVQSPYLAAHASAEPPAREIVSLWFDTPERDLLARGVAVRIDRERERRVQSVTLGGGNGQDAAAAAPAPAGGAASEWHADLVGDGPAPGVLPEGPARELLLRPEIEARLAPVFSAVHTRAERRIPLPRGGEVRLVLEAGELVAGERALPFRVGTLELLAGREAQLYQLAIRLHRECSFRLADEDLAARGYALLAPRPPTPRKAPRVRLDASMTAGEAFRRIATTCLSHLRANEACAVLGEDPEGVHQVRVATRRLRSAISVFRGALPGAWGGRISREVRWLTGEMAGARAWDVFLVETLAPIRDAMPGDPSLALLAARGAEARERAYGAVRKAIAAPRYTRLLLDLSRALSEGWEATLPVLEAARLVLAERHGKALRAGANLAHLDAEGLHRLRIRLKQLRYAVDFFADILPGKAPRKYASALAEMQDCLGLLQDVATTEPLLDPIAKGDERDTLLHATGLVYGWQAGIARRARARLEDRFRRFAKRPALGDADD
ncbi:MAG TPA: CHAD domain-containing protein [Planctomycetota bacterium]|nr:CHAD domain-containing protein [Planctomycetota bacterium]